MHPESTHFERELITPHIIEYGWLAKSYCTQDAAPRHKPIASKAADIKLIEPAYVTTGGIETQTQATG